MAILRRHQNDRATFEELDKMGQVRSMNGTIQTLVRMTVAHGRRVGLLHAKVAMIRRLEKAIQQVKLLCPPALISCVKKLHPTQICGIALPEIYDLEASARSGTGILTHV
jgi:hypothetical protein